MQAAAEPFDQRFVAPSSGWVWRAFGALLNCTSLHRLRRAVFSKFPFPKLRSDVHDVAYLTWLVDPGRIAHLVPRGLQVWQRNGVTPLTVLSYRHGHFGLEALGPLRRFCGSPLQSNWRLYLQDDEGRPAGVLFFGNIMDSILYVAGARLASDVLPTHLSARFRHQKVEDRYETEIDGGKGSAPDFKCTLIQDTGSSIPASFIDIFGDWRESVRWLSLQDLAVASVAGEKRLAAAGISLPIEIDEVVPTMPLRIESRSLDPVVRDAPVFSFIVPRVVFRVLWERMLP